MAIELRGWKARWHYGVTIVYMNDVKQYQFIRNFEKDVLCYVLVDSDNVVTDLQELAKYVEEKFHLGVLNLEEILEALPHANCNVNKRMVNGT